MTDAFGRSPLHYAALEDDVEAVEACLRGGEAVDVRDEQGFTPLHLAAQEGALTAAVVLLNAGADPNAANAHGNGPLWTAVFNSRGRGELIRLLRERGADALARNNAGRTPLELARTIGNYDVAKYFADLP